MDELNLIEKAKSGDNDAKYQLFEFNDSFTADLVQDRFHRWMVAIREKNQKVPKYPLEYYRLKNILSY